MKAIGLFLFGLACFLAGKEFWWIETGRLYENPGDYQLHLMLFVLFICAAIVQAFLIFKTS